MWQYHQEIVPCNPALIQKICAEAGADGWELCGMLPLVAQPIIKLVTPQNGEIQNQSVVLLQFKRNSLVETAEVAAELEG